jgi:diazepam-binding inhibitor (GABA receptor modulator, acyl-CoA-binding protein)
MHNTKQNHQFFLCKKPYLIDGAYFPLFFVTKRRLMASIDEEFKKVQQLLAVAKPKLNTTQKLLFYGFFKQATVGKNNTPQPKKSDLSGTYKWNAWKKVESLSQDEAKKKFIELAKTFLPSNSKL